MARLHVAFAPIAVLVFICLAAAPSGAPAEPALETVWYNCTFRGDSCTGKKVAPTTLARHVLECADAGVCAGAVLDCSGAPAGSICEMRCSGSSACRAHEISTPTSIRYESALLHCPPAVPGAGGADAPDTCVLECAGYNSCAITQVTGCERGSCAAQCDG